MSVRSPRPSHPSLDESNDASRQDAVSSLEVWLRWGPDPLRYHLANDPGRLLPGGLGEGEQLLIKEGDRRGMKSVGGDNAQRSVLGSEPAPEAMMALSGSNIQRHRTVPEAVAYNFLRFEQTKTESAAAAPNRHVRQVNDLTGQVAEAPKPLKETTVLGCRSSRHLCDPADIFGQG
jgi:hypothetical protein